MLNKISSIFNNNNKVIIYIISIFFFGIYTLLVVLNHYFFRTNALDYGFHNQIFWEFAHFNIGKSTVFEPILSNYFQVHPTFVLLIISPLYWIFNPIFGTYSLLIIQNIFIVAGGFYTYKYVILRTNKEFISIIALIHYFILLGHFSAIAFEYIDATVAASVIPVFLYSFAKRNNILTVISFLFVLTSRENMPIWFIFIGIFLIFDESEKKYKLYALTIILFSILYLSFLNIILIPALEDPQNPYWGFAYSALGKNIPEAIIFIFSHPIEAIKMLFVNHTNDVNVDGIKMEFWSVFAFSGAIVLLFRPKYIILFIPIIMQKMYNDSFNRWGINLFYSIEIVSILSIAVFSVLSKMKNSIILNTSAVIILCSTLYTTIIKLDKRDAIWYDSSKENILKTQFYKEDFNVAQFNEHLTLIPPDANVCATHTVVPHLAYRENISFYPYIRDAEYLILMLKGNTYPLWPDKASEVAHEYKNNDEWELLVEEDYCMIFKKK